MESFKGRVLVGVFCAAGAVALAGGYRALAEQSPQRMTRTVDQRVADLETKVLSLQLKVNALESTLSRVPKLGVQNAGR